MTLNIRVYFALFPLFKKHLLCTLIILIINVVFKLTYIYITELTIDERVIFTTKRKVKD